MTDKMLIDRSVAEFAVDSIEILNTGKWAQVTALIIALRAALEQPQPKREPLTAEQLADIEDMFSNEFGLEAKHAVDFARAIERAHGIIGE